MARQVAILKSIAALKLASCAALLSLLLASCGGGGDTSLPAPAPLAPMVDSFGRALAESEFGFGDPRTAGLDGTAAEGRAIAGALVRVVDTQGRVLTATTDAQGYYRIRVDGLLPPLVAVVIRPDGSAWHAPVPGPLKERGFVTANLTPLTDKLASDAARSAGKAGAAQLSPGDVAAQAAALAVAREKLQTDLRDLLRIYLSLVMPFDPMAVPFRPEGMGYDAVLDRIAGQRDASGATNIIRKLQVSSSVSADGGPGTMAPLVDLSGLVISDGVQEVPLASMRFLGNTSYDFTFATWREPGSSYSITIVRQPNSATCAVNPVSRANAVESVQVVCSTSPEPARVDIRGLDRAGLQLRIGAELIDVAPSGLPGDYVSVSTQQRYPRYAMIDLAVVRDPPGLLCRSAKLGEPDITASGVAYGAGSAFTSLICATGFFPVTGRIEGSLRSELVLRQRWYDGDQGTLLTVPAGASQFEFTGRRPPGLTYEVSAHRQPADEDCTVLAGTGVLAADTGARLAVRCAPAAAGTPRRIEGVVRFANLDGRYDFVELQAAGQTIQAVIADAGPSELPFQFPQRLAPGTPYQVVVTRSPIYFHGPYVRGELKCQVAEGGTGVAGTSQPLTVVQCGY